jgi:uncharacterized protein GlcG (DUF336 family)
MPKQPPRRTPVDTTRLKRDIAQLDSTFRAHGRASVRADNAAVARTLDKSARQAFTAASAKQDTLNRIRKGAPMPSAGHKSFAKNTEGFDGASLADRPPHMSIPRGNPTPDAIPSAHGTPALAQRADGTANLRATTVTKQAEVRAVPAGTRGPSLPQSFNDSGV